MPRSCRLLALPVVALALLSAAACSAVSRASTTCEPGQLPTLRKGTLTLETGAITQSPWVVGGGAAGRSNDPRGGKGYDAAVGYELAHRLGYDRGHVRWVAGDFAATISPGPKPFDVSINQATISERRQQRVDMSTPYWVVRDAVVTIAGRPLADVTSVAALASTPLATVTADRIDRHDGVTYVELPTYDELRRQVLAGTQQGFVTRYYAALRIERARTQLVGAKTVAVLPRVDGAEAYGMVLAKGSRLTPCVDKALAAMRDDGTLDRLERRWLVDELGLRDLR